MNKTDLQAKIEELSLRLRAKRSAIIKEFRKKVEEKSVAHLRDKLTQK